MHALPALGRSAYERVGGSEIPGRSGSLRTGPLISSAHDSHRRFERLSANLLHYFVPGTLKRFRLGLLADLSSFSASCRQFVRNSSLKRSRLPKLSGTMSFRLNVVIRFVPFCANRALSWAKQAVGGLRSRLRDSGFHRTCRRPNSGRRDRGLEAETPATRPRGGKSLGKHRHDGEKGENDGGPTRES
jgi:hypothetical protein